MATGPGVAEDLLNKWLDDFPRDNGRLVAQRACTQFDTMAILANQSKTVSHVFNTKISQEVKPITDQKSSGRCWIYATLNMLRIHFCRQHNLEEFEFSETYLYFWDKVERCNYLLSAFTKLAQSGAKCDDRTLHHLLKDPTNDGGQWQMIVNIIEKYGVLPHRVWKTSYLAEKSRRLGLLLNTQMRTNCAQLRAMVEGGDGGEQLDQAKNDMMKVLFNLISTCLGSPPTQFEFDYYDKNKKYCNIGPISPKQFYSEYVKPLCDLNDLVCLTHDPRPSSSFYELYTVDCLNNMENSAKNVVYINLPIEELKKFARVSIEQNEPVWFGCDVGKEFSNKDSILSTDLFDYEVVLGIQARGLDKANRLVYSETEMTHAMTFTGCHVVEEPEGEKRVTKWRVENSWGETKNDGKGYLVMTDDWFTEHVFEVIVNKSRLPDKVLSVLEREPIVLPAWDPMGALAHMPVG